MCGSIFNLAGTKGWGVLSHRDLLVRGLRLSVASVAWGLVSASVAVTAGLVAGSLGVLGVGLNIIGDVAGSMVLVWRFRIELRDPTVDESGERVATYVVAGALLLVAFVLTAEALVALATRTEPISSVLGLVAAAANVIVLPPLGLAKRRTGAALGSSALRGDGSLSMIGGGLAIIAIAGLVLNSTMGWWWADRIAALIVASVAATESARLLREQRSS
jgi:divalent metal cation (Fe/Co/Zn/Cd) transporter